MNRCRPMANVFSVKHALTRIWRGWWLHPPPLRSLAGGALVPDLSTFSIPPLTIPVQSLGSVEALAAGFRSSEVEVLCEGAAHLAASPDLIGKIRGALGVTLRETASPAVMNNADCTWSPPCAYQVLWKPDGDVRLGFPVPVPYVLEVEKQGQDLLIRARLFGFACEYLGETGVALVRALRRGLSGVAPGGLPVTGRAFREADGVGIPAIHSQAELEFLTPLLIRGQKSDGPVTPAAFLRGLIHRVDGFARWHGARLKKELVISLIQEAELIKSAWEETRQQNWSRGAVQQGRVVPMRGATGRLYLRGVLAPYAALIGLGELTFAGSRTSYGQGRYRLGHVL